LTKISRGNKKRIDKRTQRVNRRMIRKREGTLLLFFFVLLMVLIGRMFWWQFVKGAELASKAENNRTWDVPVEAKRGTIYDRNMHELAISISADSVYAMPAHFNDKPEEARETARILAEILQMDEEAIHKKLVSNTSFQWIKRKITVEQSEAIRAAELEGVDMTEESRRNYPNGSLACHILGISGMDNTGLEGIDLYYDETLGGVDGKIIIEHDGVGRELPEAVQSYEAPVEGNNIVLTIDESIQYFAERELKNIMTEWNASHACVVVMNPKNGEVLAMANQPVFDPNNFSDYPDENRRNFAVNDSYEPGSTMKTMTLAMALDSGVANMNNFSYDCPGTIRVGDHTIKCAQYKAHGHQNLSQIFENSCNGGFITLGFLLHKDRYFDYLDQFGFGKTTGIDLPGESAGILVNRERATDLDLATMAMGQANAVTPIQLVSAVSAIANGGTLYRPHLVKQITDQDGNILEEIQPEAVAQVISNEAARETLQILENEVLYGSGKKAQLEGYRVGGKTGTAQKIKAGGGYEESNYIVSFVGVAPIDDPKLVCLIVVDSPKGDLVYGSWVAAPGVREIFRDSLRYLEEPMDGNFVPSEEETQEQVLVPNVVNLTVDEARSALEGRGFVVSQVGEGDVVWEQTPRANTKQYAGSYVKISTISRTQESESGNITVPDLYGKTKREAADILAQLGLYMNAEGAGTVIEQSPQAGQVVGSGQVIKVKFKGVQEEEPLMPEAETMIEETEEPPEEENAVEGTGNGA